MSYMKVLFALDKIADASVGWWHRRWRRAGCIVARDPRTTSVLTRRSVSARLNNRAGTAADERPSTGHGRSFHRPRWPMSGADDRQSAYPWWSTLNGAGPMLSAPTSSRRRRGQCLWQLSEPLEKTVQTFPSLRRDTTRPASQFCEYRQRSGFHRGDDRGPGRPR
jgi:hypothetical protein